MKPTLIRGLITALCCAAVVAVADATDDLAALLDAQSDDTKSRYGARHPEQTLAFFGIEPGMTVIEALPGKGWYSRILAAWLGREGTLIGADYAWEMYPKFNFYDDDYLEAKKTWVKTWTQEARAWGDQDNANIKAFAFGSMPAEFEDQADAVLLIRALHNLARFEHDGAYLTTALGEIYRALKPGGALGVVQHMAPETAADAWANGSNGYLKKSFVIETLKKAGFEYIGESDINLNPADQPTGKDMVWRLPPTLYGVENDPKMAEKYRSIGESNRMTVLFRKPRS